METFTSVYNLYLYPSKLLSSHLRINNKVLRLENLTIQCPQSLCQLQSFPLCGYFCEVSVLGLGLLFLDVNTCGRYIICMSILIIYNIHIYCYTYKYCVVRLVLSFGLIDIKCFSLKNVLMILSEQTKQTLRFQYGSYISYALYIVMYNMLFQYV